MNIFLGVILAIIAGTMNGLFPLPMKANKEWAWENNWLPFSILSLAVFPWIIAHWLIPDLGAAVNHIDFADKLQALAWGLLIYTGSLLFGISIDLLGMGLSFSLLIGTMTTVGVLGPWIVHGELSSSGGLFILGGVALAIVSVVFGAIAAHSRDLALESSVTSHVRSPLGTLLAVIGGALSGFLPIAMSTPCSLRIQAAAMLYGHSQSSHASNLTLVFILFGGLVTNCSYCVFLLTKKGTFHSYLGRQHPMYWVTVSVMGVLYSASNALWGVAISTRLLGPLGPSIGWALFVGTIVLTSTIAGLLAGEWKGASRSSFYRLGFSVISLVAGMVLVCLGNYLHISSP